MLAGHRALAGESRVRVLEALRGNGPATVSDLAELVGLAPASAFDGFPSDIPVRNRRTIEDAIEALGST